MHWIIMQKRPKHALVESKWSCMKTVCVQTERVSYKGLRGQSETWEITREHPIKRNSMFILPLKTIHLNTAADQYSCCVSNRAVRLDSFPSQSLMNSVSAGEIKPFSESWASEGQIYMFEHTHTHTHTHTHARTKTTHPVTETWHL